jgi:hypothetical protein
MHAVLNLQTYRSDAKEYETLEEALMQASFCGFFAHDHWAQLTMVAHKDNLLGTHHDRDETLRLSGLRRFVNKNLFETKVTEARVPRSDAGCADHICGLQKLFFRFRLEMLIPFLVSV